MWAFGELLFSLLPEILATPRSRQQLLHRLEFPRTLPLHQQKAEAPDPYLGNPPLLVSLWLVSPYSVRPQSSPEADTLPRIRVETLGYSPPLLPQRQALPGIMQPLPLAESDRVGVLERSEERVSHFPPLCAPS